jgi:hypothetical protein
MWSEPVKYDTTAVIMLVSDTTFKQQIGYYTISDSGWAPHYRYNHQGPVFWIRGYEVEQIGPDWTCINDYQMQMIRNHVCYLDSKKKRINYLVWISK